MATVETLNAAGDGGGRMTREERVARMGEIEPRLHEIYEMHSGTDWPEQARDEWNSLNEELETHKRVIKEDDAARSRIAELEAREGNTEKPNQFYTRTPNGNQRNADPYDFLAVRKATNSPVEESRMLRDNTLTVLERSSYMHPDAEKAKTNEHIERLLTGDSVDNEIKMRLLTTGSDTYQRAFAKTLAGRGLTTAEQQAMDLAMQYSDRTALSDASTGVPLPFILDPTVIPTSNWSVNPFRAIARVETISGSNNWHGVTSGSITAAYAAEALEASDNTPTLTQPSATVLRAQAFVPLSFEVAEDWGSVGAAMAQNFQDAKDDLEATKFLSGTGTVEPQGVLAGLSTSQRTQTATTAVLAIGDVYNTEAALAPRWQPRAQWVTHRKQANRIRQFDTAGGAGLWIDNLRVGLDHNEGSGANSFGASLLGYGAYEVSTFSTSTASGSKIALLGDFSRGFLIVDRIGMNVEVIPHLFGTANNYPTGQRGLYARWRNTSTVLVAAAFQYLEGL